MACKHCYPQKAKETNLLRYGNSNYTKTKDYKEKNRLTVLSRYGVEHYSQTQDYKKKWDETCSKKYGKDYRKKFMTKAFDTFEEKTGYRYPSQSPEVREKAVATYYKNNSIIASKQQIYLYELYSQTCHVELNYPVSHFNVDICFPEEKIVIEYDGKGHNLSVVFGITTQEEFNQKEIIRNNVIKKCGYKTMRIISTHDLLPSDQTLLQLLSYARTYFSEYPHHSWCNFDIDTSQVFNGENKEGVFFNYGELHRLKQSA